MKPISICTSASCWIARPICVALLALVLASVRGQSPTVAPQGKTATFVGVYKRDGKPMKGADIRLSYQKPLEEEPSTRRTYPRRQPGDKWGIADADGKVRLEDVMPAVYFLLVIEPRGSSSYVAVEIANVRLEPGKTTTVEFGSAFGESAAFGRVLGVGGHPIPGARLRFSPLFKTDYEFLQTYCDSSGRYLMTDLADGAYAVTVSESSLGDEDKDGGRVHVHGETPFEIRFGTRFVEMPITGFKGDAPAEKRPNVTTIQVSRRGGGFGDVGSDGITNRSTGSIENGIARIEGTFKGTYKVSMLGSIPGTRSVFFGRTSVVLDIDTTQGSQTVKPIRLPDVRACELRGRVVDSQGAPLSGVTVRLSIESNYRVSSSADTTTDSDGRFNYAGLYPAKYDISARTPNGTGVKRRTLNIEKDCEETIVVP